MNKLAKVLVTIGVIFVFFLLFAALVGGREASGHKTPGFLGLILFAVVYYGVRAIWKNEKKDNNDDNDISVLQK